METIRLKKDSKPIELNGELMMMAYSDTFHEIKKGASKSTTTMGIVNINGIEKLLSIVIEDLE